MFVFVVDGATGRAGAKHRPVCIIGSVPWGEQRCGTCDEPTNISEPGACERPGVNVSYGKTKDQQVGRVLSAVRALICRDGACTDFN